MASARTERECLFCHSKFIPARVGGRHKGIYCSVGCRINGRQRIQMCPTCGTEFVSHWKARHCSRACSSVIYQGSGNPFWKGGKVSRICETCSSPYEAYPSQKIRFCSKACSHQGIGSAGELNGNWRGGMVTLTCLNCKREFEVIQSRASKTVYCSNDCFHAHNFSRSADRWKRGSRWGMSGTKSGKRADIGIFVRSSWEANYARYLNLLKKLGVISSWDYEKETFEFTGIKRGTRFYTPDFKIVWSDGRTEYHEVKGWMHPKGKTALTRMSRYYPDIKIVLIRQPEYRQLAKEFKPLIPQWE